MLKQLTPKRWTSLLLAVVLTLSLLPIPPASAAVTFTFDNFSTDPSSPTQVNGNTIDVSGSFSGVAANTITYKVEQIVDGKVVATTPGTGITPIIEGTNRYIFANVQLFPGLNKITVSGNASGSIQSDSAYVFFPNVPTIYDIQLTDGRELSINRPTLVNTETVALFFRAPNATSVTVQGRSAFSGGGDTFLVSDVPLDEGLNTLVFVASNATNTYSVTRDVVRLYDQGTTAFDVKIVGGHPDETETLLDGYPTVGSNDKVNDRLIGYVKGKFAVQKDPANPVPSVNVDISRTSGGLPVLNVAATTSKLMEVSVTGATYDYEIYEFETDPDPAQWLTISDNDQYSLALTGTYGAEAINFSLLFNYRQDNTPYITDVWQLYNVTETVPNSGVFSYTSSSLFTDNLTFFQTPIWVRVDMNNYDDAVHKIALDTLQGGAVLKSPHITYEEYVSTNGEVILKITNLPAGDQTLNIRVQDAGNSDIDVKRIPLTFIPTPFIQLVNLYDGQTFKAQGEFTSSDNDPEHNPAIIGKLVNFNMTFPDPNDQSILPVDLTTLTVSINGTEKSVASDPGRFYLAQDVDGNYTGEFRFNNYNDPNVDRSLQLVNGPNSIVISAKAGGIPISTHITVYLFPDNVPQVTLIKPVPVGESSDPDNLYQPTGELSFTTTERTVEVLFSVVNVMTPGGEVVVNIDGQQHTRSVWNSTTNSFDSESGIQFIDSSPGNVANFRLTYSAPANPEDTSLALPETGTKSITIMAAAGTTTSSKTLQITRIRVPYRILSPMLPEERVINQNFITVSIEAEGADEITIGKERMVKGPDDIFRLELNNLKKGDNKIKFTITTGSSKTNGEFTITYATQNEVGAQYKAQLPSSGKISAFNGAIEISFPKGTMLKRPSETSQINAPHIDLFNSQQLLLGIADPLDGRTVKRYNRVGEYVNGVAQDGKFNNINENQYVKNILQGTRANFGYASDLFWVDAGYFDNSGNTFKLVDGLHPYETTNNDAVYLRGNNPNKWLVPTNRGTITLKYDPSIRDEAARNLSVWRFTGNAWHNIGGVVKTNNKTITAPFDGFGYYAVMMMRYGFEDITGHPYARNHLNAMYAKGIMQPRSNANFGVYENITRGEFATMIVKILDLPLNYDTQPSMLTFNDVPNYAVSGALWDYRYIETAARAGIISGLAPRIFNPGGYLTREQAATIIARAMNYKIGDPEKDRATLTKQFTDAGLIDYYAISYVQAVVKDKIMQGLPNPLEEGQTKPTFSFNPKSFLNRADMAIISYNLMTKLKRL